MHARDCRSVADYGLSCYCMHVSTHPFDIWFWDEW